MTWEEAVRIVQGEEYAQDIGELSRARLFLGGYYAYANSRLADILSSKPAEWNKIRYNGQTKSDTAAEREWEATPLGVEEMQIRKKLKSIEMMMTALNTRIQVLQGEARNYH